MKKKKILAIILVLLVVLLGGASVYVATQLSTRKAVAPTAPESKPKAVEPTIDWVGCEACTVTASASTVVWSIKKDAILDDSSNTAGSYKLTSSNRKTGNNAMVTPGETFVYEMFVTNSSSATMSGVTLKDILTGENLDKLTFVDAFRDCSYESSTRTVTCSNISVRPGTSAYGWGFRVKVADDIADGTIIKNTFSATHNGETKEATNTLTAKVAAKAVLEGSMKAYKNVTSNTAGKYSLTTEVETVSKSQIYVYTIELKNTSKTVASGVVIKDSLADMPVTYMDTVAGCTWSAANIELTCNGTVKPEEIKKFSFRVKASDGVSNGTVISNTANVTYPDGSLDLTKDLAVSTVVGCNHTCTTDEECSTGLVCDTTTSKCRKEACLTEDDCTCAVVVTRAPTTPTATRVPTATKTITPTEEVAIEVTAKATPTILPETGIFDLPGMVAFGGGLFLAVVGILLAL